MVAHHLCAVFIALARQTARILHAPNPYTWLYQRADGPGYAVLVHLGEGDLGRPWWCPPAFALRQYRFEVTRRHVVMMKVDAPRSAARRARRLCGGDKGLTDGQAHGDANRIRDETSPGSHEGIRRSAGAYTRHRRLSMKTRNN